MHRIGIILVITVIFGFVAYLLYSPTNGRDILLKSRDYREADHFILNDQRMPTIGVSTEMDVYSYFGSDVDRRLTFKNKKEKTINGTPFEFNKIIVYEDYVYEYTSQIKDGDEVQINTPTERSQAVIYLLDGTVTFYSVRKQVKSGDDYVTTSPAVNLDENGEVWPNSMQEIADYRSQ